MLEISATPYLYTLRFYDCFVATETDGSVRFTSTTPSRTSTAVETDPASRNWFPPRRNAARARLEELLLGRHPDLFFAVHRLDFTDEVEDDTKGRFHVLNLVEGDRIEIATASETSTLSFAETIVVPAAGAYRAAAHPRGSCKVVKALVP